MTDMASPATAPSQTYQRYGFACLLFGAAFIAHAIFTALDVFEALRILNSDAFGREAGAAVQLATVLRVAASDAAHAAFLLLGWIAAAWMSKNDRMPVIPR